MQNIRYTVGIHVTGNSRKSVQCNFNIYSRIHILRTEVLIRKVFFYKYVLKADNFWKQIVY